MKKYHLIIITSFILINNFFFLNLQSEIINKIVVKVGGSLITSIDIQNEIVTNLVLNKQEIIQKNVEWCKTHNLVLPPTNVEEYEVLVLHIGHEISRYCSRYVDDFHVFIT